MKKIQLAEKDASYFDLITPLLLRSSAQSHGTLHLFGLDLSQPYADGLQPQNLLMQKDAEHMSPLQFNVTYLHNTSNANLKDKR